MVVISEGTTPILHISVTFSPNNLEPDLIVWVHNGSIVDAQEDSRVSVHGNGSLIVTQVRPSDAGNYTVSVCNSLGCDSAHFSVTVECT